MKETDIYGNTRKLSKTEKGLKIHSENETYKKHGQDQVKEARREIADKDLVFDSIRTSKQSNQVKRMSLVKVSNTQKENNVVNDGAKGSIVENDLGKVIIQEKDGVTKANGKDCGSQNLKSNINISKNSNKRCKICSRKRFKICISEGFKVYNSRPILEEISEPVKEDRESKQHPVDSDNKDLQFIDKETQPI